MILSEQKQSSLDYQISNHTGRRFESAKGHMTVNWHNVGVAYGSVEAFPDSGANESNSDTETEKT